MGIGNISRTDSVNILDIVSKIVPKNRSHGLRKKSQSKKISDQPYKYFGPNFYFKKQRQTLSVNQALFFTYK